MLEHSRSAWAQFAQLGSVAASGPVSSAVACMTFGAALRATSVVLACPRVRSCGWTWFMIEARCYCKMVYDAGGVAAIRALADAGHEPRAVLSTASHLLNVSSVKLDSLWRHQIATLAP